MFVFAKRNMSRAKRGWMVVARRVRGQGRQSLCPASALKKLRSAISAPAPKDKMPDSDYSLMYKSH